MRNHIIWTLFIAALFTCGLPPELAGRVEVTLSRGVDTTDVDKRAIFALWVDYLNAEPDAIWTDPDWNATKSRFWRDFDLTAPFVYQTVGDSILSRYEPIVMAIDEEAEGRFSIRTLFYREGLRPPADTQNPWAIVRVYAERVDGEWKLRNALGVMTRGWHRPAIGKITFVSPPSHDFDVSRALRSIAFCDSIGDAYDFFQWDSFDFYITGSREEADEIIGLEYYLDRYSWGGAFRSQDILISGRGTEWYPNGLIQMVATGPSLDPHPVVRRGFAGWIGGWDKRSYADNMGRAAEIVAENETISFEDYISRGRGGYFTGAQWFPGAVLCDMVFAARGAEGIEMLFEAGSTDVALYEGIESTLGLGRAAFERAWRQKVLEFSR
jgi:hypothetical protein